MNEQEKKVFEKCLFNCGLFYVDILHSLLRNSFKSKNDDYCVNDMKREKYNVNVPQEYTSYINIKDNGRD